MADDCTRWKPADIESKSFTVTGTQNQALNISVVGAPLPIDPNLVWIRVQRLLGVEVPPPERIVVREPVENRTLGISPFYRAITGTDVIRIRPSVPGGSVNDPETVHIRISNRSSPSDDIEWILAHEFVHVVQLRKGVRLEKLPIDVRLALLEGGAVFTTDAYIRAYMPGESSQSSKIFNFYQNTTPERRYGPAHSYFGFRYIDSRANSTGEIWQVYEEPPLTTEQILHPHIDQTEALSQPGIPYAVSGWEVSMQDNKGELFVRVFLDTHIRCNRAERAAAGWSNDHLMQLTDGDIQGFLWLLRWDTSTDANEFNTTMLDFKQSRQASDTGAELENEIVTTRISKHVTAVLVGPPEFGDGIEITVENGMVEISRHVPNGDEKSN